MDIRVLSHGKDLHYITCVSVVIINVYSQYILDYETLPCMGRYWECLVHYLLYEPPFIILPISALSYMDFIITAGKDGSIKLWSPSIAQVLGELAGHSREVVGMTIHPTKPQLLSAAADGSVRVWGLDTLTELYLLLMPEENLSSFALIDASHAICYSQKGVIMLNICMVSKSMATL